jgi:hypothetical protein
MKNPGALPLSTKCLELLKISIDAYGSLRGSRGGSQMIGAGRLLVAFTKSVSDRS